MDILQDSQIMYVAHVALLRKSRVVSVSGKIAWVVYRYRNWDEHNVYAFFV